MLQLGRQKACTSVSKASMCAACVMYVGSYLGCLGVKASLKDA
jgi:hypothetical protein